MDSVLNVLGTATVPCSDGRSFGREFFIFLPREVKFSCNVPFFYSINMPAGFFSWKRYCLILVFSNVDVHYGNIAYHAFRKKIVPWQLRAVQK